VSIPAVALCVTGGVAVGVGLIIADRFEKVSAVILTAGCIAMWVAFWVETLA